MDISTARLVAIRMARCMAVRMVFCTLRRRLANMWGKWQQAASAVWIDAPATGERGEGDATSQ